MIHKHFANQLLPRLGCPFLGMKVVVTGRTIDLILLELLLIVLDSFLCDQSAVLIVKDVHKTLHALLEAIVQLCPLLQTNFECLADEFSPKIVHQRTRVVVYVSQQRGQYHNEMVAKMCYILFAFVVMVFACEGN